MDQLKNCGLKESTLKNYKTSLNLAHKQNITYEMTSKEIINRLEDMRGEYKINTIKNVLNVLLVLKKCTGSDSVKELVDYRNQLNEEQALKLSIINTKLLDKDPNKELKNEILNYTEELFQSKDYKRYLINYLIINFSVRNQDLYLSVINEGDDIDPEKNYLITNNDGTIKYIRNFYKTVETYGPKEHIITDNNFHVACNNLLGQKLLTYAFQNIGAEVRSCTYKGLGEGAYFKLFVRDAGGINDIKRFVNNRGTQFETVYDFYNLDK